MAKALLKIPLMAMKHERERERYPNGVSISAKHISGRSYGYTVHYGGWHEKLFTAPGPARKFADKMSNDGARSNPANPADSVLKGAQILGVTRNAKGVVTALKLRLKRKPKGMGRGK